MIMKLIKSYEIVIFFFKYCEGSIVELTQMFKCMHFRLILLLGECVNERLCVHADVSDGSHRHEPAYG